MRLVLICAFFAQAVGGPMIAACAAEAKACAMRAKSCCSRTDEAAGEPKPCCCSHGKPRTPPRPEQPKPSPHEDDSFGAALLPAPAIPAESADGADEAPAVGRLPLSPPDHHTRQALICRWTN